MGYGATFPKLKSYYSDLDLVRFSGITSLAKRGNGFAKSMAMVFRWSRQGVRFIKMKSSPILSHDLKIVEELNYNENSLSVWDHKIHQDEI